MANEPVERSGSLLQSVARMIDAAVNDGTGYESLVPVLSLICLVSILSHGQPRAAQTAPAAGANTLQKLLGDLSKGEGGGLGPEALVSLLPLLNNPQIKSKLNPATIGAVMGLLNNLGDKGDKSETGKQEAAKQDKGGDKGDKNEEKRVVTPTAATMTSPDLPERQNPHEEAEGDKKGPGRYLNWKSTF